MSLRPLLTLLLLLLPSLSLPPSDASAMSASASLPLSLLLLLSLSLPSDDPLSPSLQSPPLLTRRRFLAMRGVATATPTAAVLAHAARSSAALCRAPYAVRIASSSESDGRQPHSTLKDLQEIDGSTGSEEGGTARHSDGGGGRTLEMGVYSDSGGDA